MPAASNRAHHPALGGRPVGHPVCGLQAAADIDRLRAARCRMGRLVHPGRPALVTGAAQLRCRPALVHVADLRHGPSMAGGITQAPTRSARKGWERYARMGGRSPVEAGSVMGGIGGRSPADGGAIVAHVRSCSRWMKVAPGQRCLRALEAMPGENPLSMIERSEPKSVSGFLVTPGHSATGCTSVKPLNPNASQAQQGLQGNSGLLKTVPAISRTKT